MQKINDLEKTNEKLLSDLEKYQNTSFPASVRIAEFINKIEHLEASQKKREMILYQNNDEITAHFTKIIEKKNQDILRFKYELDAIKHLISSIRKKGYSPY